MIFLRGQDRVPEDRFIQAGAFFRGKLPGPADERFHQRFGPRFVPVLFRPLQQYIRIMIRITVQFGSDFFQDLLYFRSVHPMSSAAAGSRLSSG